MKNFIPLYLLALLPIMLSAQSSKTCGKPNDPNPERCPDCEESTESESSAASLGPSSNTPTPSLVSCDVDTPSSLIPLNHGGVALSSSDLKIPGSTSGFPMEFSRYYHSRDSASYGDMMGHGRTFSHSYSWRMTAAGSEYHIFFPSGKKREFTLSGASSYRGNASQLYLPAAGYSERLHQIGNFWHLVLPGAVAYTFERVVLPDNTVLFHPRSARDSRDNILTFTTDTSARIIQVTDFVSNTITLSYSSQVINRKTAVPLHTISAAPVVGWNEVTIPAGQSFRWLQAVSAPNAFFDVSEIEFYQSNGSGGHTKITGTAYGTSPAHSNNANLNFDKAFDNNTSTRFKFCRPNHGIAGIDLGFGNAAEITKIRYFIASTFSSELGKFVGMRFEGMVEQPQTTTMLSSVSTSTGHSVEFQYGTFEDTSVGQTYGVLEKAIYRDASSTVTD
jgi:hypothetical protein